jgi:hypothetical protein
MTDEQIKAWLTEAYGVLPYAITDGTRKFCELVAAHEREECAKACDAEDENNEQHWPMGAEACAAVIRARGQHQALKALADQAQELGMGY